MQINDVTDAVINIATPSADATSVSMCNEIGTVHNGTVQNDTLDNTLGTQN